MGVESLVDWEQIDMIADGYTPEFLEILREFATELPVLIAALSAAGKSNDVAEVARVAHQIKGSAANFGFRAVSAKAASIETAAKAGTWDDFPARSAEASALWNASLAELRAQRGLEI